MKHQKSSLTSLGLALALHILPTGYCAEPALGKSPSDPTVAGGGNNERLGKEAAAMFAKSESRRKDPSVRRKNATIHAEQSFGPVLDGMELTPAQKRTVLDALIERYLDRLDTLDSLNEKKIYTKASRSAALASAVESTDRTIEETLSPKHREKFKKALEAEYYLGVVAHNEAKMLEAVGHPLSPSQRLELAIAEYETINPEINPAAKNRFQAPLNGMGLIDAEEELLSRMQGILDSEQIFTIRNLLIQGQRSARR